MPRLRAALAFAIVFTPVITYAQASPQPDAALWRFVYPDAKALVSIDWVRIRQSQTADMIREKWLSLSGMPLPSIPGIELLDDIDRILISSPANKSPDDSTQPPVLIAIHGHFDPAKVHQVFARWGAKAQSYNAFQVYRPQGKDAKQIAWVLFDAETILFGDPKAVFTTLDRNQFGPPPQTANPLLARAAEMDANYDFWFIMDAAEIMSSDSVAGLLRGGEWASEARGFEAGVNVRGGLAADLTIRFSSDEVAKRMTAELTHIINMAAKDKSSGVGVQEIAKKLKFALDGSAAKISLRLTQQELDKTALAFAAAQKTAFQAGRNTAWTIQPVQPKPALTPIPAPAKPAVIRIEGLDDGPREIPFPDQQH